MIQIYVWLRTICRLICSAGATFSLLICLQEPAAAQLSLPNIDFSSGNFTNWQCWVGIATRGTLTTGTFFDSSHISAPIGGNEPGPNKVNKSRHFITSGTDTDFYGGFPIVSPAGGMHSLRIGNDSAKTRADRVQYYIHVPSSSSSFNIQCEFAVVVEDGGHNADEQATFQVVAYDSASGTVLPAANNLYIAHFAVPGFLTDRSPTPFYLPDVYYLPWTASTVNLSGMGGKTVILECTALDCMYGGHMGYGYFDVTGVADSLMASIISYNSVGDSVLLQGPPGYKTYQWYNQDFSLVLNNATDTERIKSVLTPPSPQYYNLIVTPYASIGLPDTIRTPLLKAHNLSVSSPLLSLASVYPNPVGAVMHVQFKTPFSGMLSVLNYGGETVFSENLAGKASFHIATTAFATGIYKLVLKNRDGTMNVLQVCVKH